MTDDHAVLESFTGLTRLFPLPNLVLFPHAVQGLHIFESRYRQMTSDALADDQLISTALLKPEWETCTDGLPPIEPVICLGRIVQVERLADGRFNLALRGLSRTRLLEEVPSDKPYRLARVEVVTESATEDVPRLLQLREALSEAVLSRFDASSESHHQLSGLFLSDQPLGPVCDILAFSLPLPLQLKQQLLEESRAEVRAEILTYAVQPQAAHPPREFPPPFSEN